MNGKTAKLIRRFATETKTSYTRNKRFYLATPGTKREYAKVLMRRAIRKISGVVA